MKARRSLLRRLWLKFLRQCDNYARIKTAEQLFNLGYHKEAKQVIMNLK